MVTLCAFVCVTAMYRLLPEMLYLNHGSKVICLTLKSNPPLPQQRRSSESRELKYLV